MIFAINIIRLDSFLEDTIMITVSIKRIASRKYRQALNLINLAVIKKLLKLVMKTNNLVRGLRIQKKLIDILNYYQILCVYSYNYFHFITILKDERDCQRH
jgi:hypothetical protein